jgi:hypothetical protein
MVFMLEQHFVNMDEEKKSGSGYKISFLRILSYGTLLALIIAIPAVIVTIITHYVIHTGILITATSGILVLFISMGLGYKIAKKLAGALTQK